MLFAIRTLDSMLIYSIVHIGHFECLSCATTTSIALHVYCSPFAPHCCRSTIIYYIHAIRTINGKRSSPLTTPSHQSLVVKFSCIKSHCFVDGLIAIHRIQIISINVSAIVAAFVNNIAYHSISARHC